ncbi:hypothetical protein BOTBODRAFT_46501 [Botryobasidium botryosum FD-172 SS1]|uniref:Uncharacterized protein n=1 Tax=Botryobasidium botryosum (strain FD-172 SS1) TaxID=930990 RepID=A0A067MIK6_BOTB1|nr:hypothetical protein BOTBODRAFT_46501 [Botryobasidium botryosum FD-172 SS1]
MSYTETLSSSPLKLSLFHGSDARTLLLGPPAKRQDILNKQPSEVVDLALSRMREMGVQMIEWGTLLYRRMDVPRIMKDYAYVVPDDQVALASNALVDLGLPLSIPSKFQLSVDGEFQARGRHHRITQHLSTALIQHVIIYPQSFTTLTDDELITTTPNHISSPLCSTILIPPPPVVFASLVRMMLRYTRFDPTLLALQSDLSELITYHLLGLADGYVDLEDDDEWESKDVDNRIETAVHLIRSWSVDCIWREGEEWIGDALAEVVRTGMITRRSHYEYNSGIEKLNVKESSS